jgi:Phage-related protein, predicted endonuclease
MDHPTVGASQIAALMGCHPWLDVHKLWRSLVHGEKQDQNEAMSRGVQFEPVVAMLYAKANGLLRMQPLLTPDPLPTDCLFVQPPRQIRFDIDGTYLHATPDALRFNDGQAIVAEFKTSESYSGWGEPGTSQVPTGYLMQVQVQMLAAEAKRAEIAVLLPHFDFRIYPIEAMPALQELLEQAAKEFIEDYVIPQKMPPTDHTEACRQNILDLFPEPKEDYLRAEDIPGIHEVLVEWQADQVALKELETRMDERKNKIRELIGDHAGIQSELGRVDHKKPKASETVDYKLVSEDLAMELAQYQPPGALELAMKRHTEWKTNSRRLATYWKKA